MPISYAEQYPYTCDGCGHSGNADLWLLIDVAERPDLVERVKTKRLRIVSCASCLRSIELLHGVLLIYRPHDQLLMFVGRSVPEPSQAWSGPDNKALWLLCVRLAHELGAQWDNRMLDNVVIVPSTLAHLMIDEQRVLLLDSMLHDLAQSDWKARRQMVINHPELTDADVLDYLDWKNLACRNRMDHDGEALVQEIRDFLRRVRDAGVERASAECSSAMPFITELEKEHPQLSNALRQLAESGVDVLDRDALRDSLNANAQWRHDFDEAVAATRAALTEQAARTELDPQIRKDACLLLAGLVALDPDGQPVEAFNHTFAAAVVLLGPGPQQAERASMSISCLKSQLPALVAEGAMRQQVLIYLAHAYIQRGRPGDLDQADDCLGRAVGATSASAPAATQILVARGRLLWAQADTRGDDALHDAIAVHRDLLDHGGIDLNTISTANHMIALCYQYLTTGDRITNLRTGIDFARRALDADQDAMGQNTDLMTIVQLELALLEQDPASGADAVLGHLRAGVRNAEKLGLSDSLLYFADSLGMLEADRGNWTEAASAYEAALAAADHFYDEIDTEGDRRQLVSEIEVMNARAAYALAKAGRLNEAAHALERGRARALARAMRRERSELTKLDAVRPDLAKRFRDVADRLSVLEQHARDDAAGMSGRYSITHDAASSYARQAAYDYDAVVNDIRALPGFEGFLSPPGFRTLVDRLPTDEVVAYLCATKHGSLAVIVKAENATVEVEFGSLTSDVVTELVEDSGYARGQLGYQSALSASLPQVLSVVGERLLSPLSARLLTMRAQRVLLIPCGYLGLFPLHAAVLSAQTADHGLDRMLDRFEVSYAPSLELYLVARDRLARLAAHPLALAGVGDPEPNPRPLMFARIEIAHVAELFTRLSEASPVTLVGREARTVAVMAAVAQATHVHFACHGYFSPKVPLDSGLVMAAEDRLTLRDVMASPDFDDVRMVVMSACQTGMTDVNDLPEEVIGLPSGFLHAGVPAVVGALWSVDDISTALLMMAFYQYLQGGTAITPAAAMRAAQRRIASMRSDEIQKFIDSDITRDNDSKNVRGTSRALTPVLDDQDEWSLTHPFADPYFWAAFTVNGC